MWLPCSGEAAFCLTKRMQPPSLVVTSTAPRAVARNAPAAPALTLAGGTRSVRWPGERSE